MALKTLTFLIMSRESVKKPGKQMNFIHGLDSDVRELICKLKNVLRR